MGEKDTWIRIKESTKKMLVVLKLVPSESYDSVINRVFKKKGE